MGDNPGFKEIVITTPGFFEGEAEVIERLLANGADYVHIRKPEFSGDEVRALIASIAPEFHPRLRLHSHPELLADFNLAGVQLNSRLTNRPPMAKSVSKSCHSIEELADADEYEYVTLSPIYDSISKKGYLSAFSVADLANILSNRNVIALGGVTPEKYPELSEVGFVGAALLGHVWKNPSEFISGLKNRKNR